jgi:cellulose synthase/poly-beta-1,6-N-acetylglucosamine synthase-like glycosyltransferase
LPDISVVIPVLNEEDLILEKLENLRDSDYPWERMKIMFVDGGSSDRTLTHLKSEIAHDENIELVHIPDARARPDQINCALQRVDREIVVFTDVDARLEPSCLRKLVTHLVDDPSTAVLGAFIRPRTPLIEERLYWWFLSHLWWLEGEVLSSANVSGVCYACRREHLLPLVHDAYADDISVALTVSARGHRVRICRSAIAEEVRVPQKAPDLVRFRRKRGKLYLRELKRLPKLKQASLQWRLTNLIRLWHFLVTPKIIPIILILTVLLIFSPYWLQVLFVLGLFALSVLLAMFLSKAKKNLSCPWWKLPLATARLAALVLMSMLSLKFAQRDQMF